MKISHFLALLKNDSRIVWSMIFLAPLYAYFSIREFRQDQMFELTPTAGGGAMLFMLPFLMWYFLFEDQSYGLKPGPRASLVSLEFMFTRAIDRVSLFCVKTSLFLVISATPLVVIWAYSFTAPSVRVELPYNSLQHREETKQFYLSHFDEAYLQEPDDGRKKDYVVLPHGRTNQAVCTFLFTFAATLLFQVMLFFFRRRRWIALVSFFFLMILSSFAALSRHSPSPYEKSLAWVNQHAFLAVAALFALTGITQRYCCWRFVNTEITS
jgi:hypothetical protein